jgi:N-acetylglucosamine malate deacetylase 1
VDAVTDATDPGSVTAVDLLAIGPHPDDIEIGMGGTVAKHVALGLRVGLCDLTAGEMGSNGTVDERLAEAEAARVVLGAAWRVNLTLPDRQLGGSAEHVLRIAALVRAARPRVVAIPHWSDRHPDHVAASHLCTEAIFSAGLRRFPAGPDKVRPTDGPDEVRPTRGPDEVQPASDSAAWKPEWVCYYFINDSVAPSFVIDVGGHYEVKRRALACHASQFRPAASGAVATRLTSSRFSQLIESRDAQFGALSDVDFAEGFVVKQPLLRPHLLRDWTAP